MNETHFWLLLAMLALALLCAWFYRYVTRPQDPAAPTVPPSTDRYIRELQQARRQKALKAAQRTLEEVRDA
jgi:hypothetical protein